MRYIIKNIYLLIKNETFLAISIVICISTSSWTMLFAYGIFQNFNVAKTYNDEAVWSINPEISENAEFTVGDFIRYVEAIPAETGNNAAIFLADFIIDDWFIQNGIPTLVIYTIRVGVKDNIIVNSDYLLNVWEKSSVEIGTIPY